MPLNSLAWENEKQLGLYKPFVDLSLSTPACATTAILTYWQKVMTNLLSTNVSTSEDIRSEYCCPNDQRHSISNSWKPENYAEFKSIGLSSRSSSQPESLPNSPIDTQLLQSPYLHVFLQKGFTLLSTHAPNQKIHTEAMRNEQPGRHFNDI